jgi:peptidoglycan/LPS O-acetylase OafA/YrhL
VPDVLLTPAAAQTAGPAAPLDAGPIPAADSRPASPARKPQLPALTGIRTLLAVGIMLFHFTPPHMGPFYPVIDNSFVFVGFFILLSGFILAYNYADRPTLNKRDFWLARFARLYPVYLLSLVLFFGMLANEWHAHSHPEFFAGVILTPLMLQSWSPTLATFWNTVAWTLSVEAMLYIAFPWMLKLPWPKSPGRLIALLLVIWAVGLIPHTLYIWLNPDHLPGPANRYSSGTWIRMLKFTPLSYVCIFLSGITLGKIQATLQLDVLHRTLLAAVSLAALWLFFARGVQHVPYLLMHGGFLVPLFAALVIGLSGQNIFASMFSWKPIELLGQASYALFLLHFNFLNLLHRNHVTQRLHLAAYDPWISYAACLVLSVIAMQLVERPARRAILSRRTA